MPFINGIDVRVWVENTSARDGKEVVQVYIHETDPVVYRPVRELKAFEKVPVKACEKQEVVLTLGRANIRPFLTPSQRPLRIKRRVGKLDADLEAKAYRIGGEVYVLLCDMSYRQAVAAHKLITDEDGNILFLSKNNRAMPD